jgi:hypothetical protein
MDRYDPPFDGFDFGWANAGAGMPTFGMLEESFSSAFFDNKIDWALTPEKPQRLKPNG